ncbi:hypothetical protein [Arthrobacter psychrolactophilus]
MTGTLLSSSGGHHGAVLVQRSDARSGKDAQSGWKSLIGPYESRAEAEQALAKVRERNELADAQEDDDEDA